MHKIVSRGLLFGLLAFVTLASSFSSATIESTGVGGGTLSWPVTSTSGNCGFEGQSQYTQWNLGPFTFAIGGNNYPLGGSAAYIQSPGGSGCPVPGPEPATGEVLQGSGYTITLTAESGGYGSAVYSSTGILYPKFKIASIIYDTPGNSSNNGFTDTLTDGTTTSTGSNFGVGITDTFSVSDGFLGAGDTLSWSAGVATTEGNTTAVTDTIAQGTGVLNGSNHSSPNAINHQQDLFIIWLNPAVAFTATGTSTVTYGMGTQLQTAGDPSPGTPEMQDHVEVYAQAMMANSSGVTTVPVEKLQPQLVSGQTLPGLANICANPKYYPSSCTLANQCGCVPSDFTAVLNQDPLLNYTATESPLNADTSGATLCTNPTPTAKCRYVPIMTANDGTTQVVELLAGPDDVGGNQPYNLFTQTDSTQTAQTYSESITYSVGYAWDVKWMAFGNGFDFKSQTVFSWGNSESTGTINGSAHQMSVSLSSSTVGCSEYIPIFEDTVYHTFVFQGQAGDNSCP
jgi:hypothetical protein